MKSSGGQIPVHGSLSWREGTVLELPGYIYNSFLVWISSSEAILPVVFNLP